MPDELTPKSQDALMPIASHFTIRTAQQQDLTLLAEILTDSFHSCQGMLRWVYPILRLGIYEDLRNRIRTSSPHYACLVAVATISGVSGARERVVGTVELSMRHLSPWRSNASQYPYISNLAVSKSCRRQGGSSRIAQSLRSQIPRMGFSGSIPPCSGKQSSGTATVSENRIPATSG